MAALEAPYALRYHFQGISDPAVFAGIAAGTGIALAAA